MEVLINGCAQSVSASCNLAELVRQCAEGDTHCAVALNDTVVPRGQMAATIVRAGDRIEIVHAVGGG